MTKFEEIDVARVEYHKAIKKLGKAAVAEALKDVFDKFPDLLAVHWTQYTPGFNDGDPCTFGLGEVGFQLSMELATVEHWGVEYSDERFCAECGEKLRDDEDQYVSDYYIKDKALKAAYGVFAGLIQENEDILEDVFGNDKEITATRDGVDVEDYDCGF